MPRDPRPPLTERSSRRFVALLGAAAYVLATAVTRPVFTGDAPDYADSLVARLRGQDYLFWEAGHLLWRPIGYLAFRGARPIAGWTTANATVAGAESTLAALAWAAGLACVVLLAALLGRLGVPRFAASATVLLLVTAHAFLDYAQAGSSYVPGLAFLLLGMYLLARAGAAAGDDAGDARAPRRAVVLGAAGGVALAGAVFMWLLYVLALPAAFLLPVIFGGADRARWRVVAASVAACAVCGAVVYGAVAAVVGATTPATFLAWLQQSSHGIAGTGGVARAVFGIARSYVNMGNDGALVKRFMLHDPYNPVTRGDLLRLSLWKVALFYAFAAAAAVGAARTAAGRRALLLAALAALPTVAFALLWQAGDLERYLPALPALCVLVAFALGGWAAATTTTTASRPTRPTRPLLSRAVRAVVLLFVLVAAAVNVRALSAAAIAADEARVNARVGALAASLPPHSVVVTANWHDELVSLSRASAGRGVNAHGRLPLYALVTPGSPAAPAWRAELARRALAAWAEGGEIWLSRRALSPRPASRWNWVEGDDPRVSWRDFAPFFAPFDLGPASVGGADGFVLVPRTAANVARLQEAAK